MCQPSTLFQPLYLTVAGGGGTVTSKLAKTIIGVMRRIFQCNGMAIVGGPTGSASFNGDRTAVHRLFGILPNSFGKRIGADKERRLKETFRNIFFLVIDKRSMISADLLGRVETTAKVVVHNVLNKKALFGGIPVIILVGDDYQLPPVDIGASENFSNDFLKEKTITMGITHHVLEMFKNLGENYIKLETSKRFLKG